MDASIDLHKQYWVFCCPQYYPLGGLEDINFTTNDKDEAIEKANEFYSYCFDSISKTIIQ